MIAAQAAVQRPPDAKLLVVDDHRNLIHVPRSAFVDFLHPNDVVIANDAATLPASLSGIHQETGNRIEVRLIGVGTTVVRALEDAATEDGQLRTGEGLAHKTHWSNDSFARRRCNSLRHTRTRHQPLRTPARVH